ncbi:unnamed protein product [Paramecium sonneborni]|uniref:Protein kinase domain-containing protein n=1 Tax=Paramecium sonneborni TaxID=65129 RepID=A0A8S1N065_9CILI|nr:unnamed protein product [Paramecium sonneborni]
MQNWKLKYKTKGGNLIDDQFQNTIDAIRMQDNLQVCLMKIPKINDSYHFSIMELIQSQRYDNLVNVLEIFDENDYAIVVLEQCSNNLLHYFQINNYNFTTEQIFSFIKQITKGYQQLIEMWVLHRDLKPENIFYIQRNQDIIFKIGGYKFAKLLDDRDQPIDEHTQLYSGDGYWAPEACTINYSYNADIFSFGLIILQMATKIQIQNIQQLKQQNLLNICKLDKMDDNLKQLLCQMIVYDHTKRLNWSTLVKQLFYTPQIQTTKTTNKQFELGICLENGQPCYIKIIQKQIKDCQYYLANAKAELDNNRLLKGINHPNIVKIYEILHEPENSCIYLIMEQCQGSLMDLLQNKSFSFEAILDLIVQINTGYKYLEEKNIIHRDIKPENILYQQTLQNKIQYKIADFGISRRTDKACTKCGTIIYSAPEIDGNHLYTNKCDIFSLGILLYYVTTKNYPFDINDKTGKTKFLQLLKEKQSIQYIYPDNLILDPRIKTILNRMIIFEPAHRISWGEQITQLVQTISQPQIPQPTIQFRPPIKFQPSSQPSPITYMPFHSQFKQQIPNNNKIKYQTPQQQVTQAPQKPQVKLQSQPDSKNNSCQVQFITFPFFPKKPISVQNIFIDKGETQSQK